MAKSLPVFLRRDEEFMRLALAKAAEGISRGQTPFGACIVRRGQVVALSHNRVWQTTDITAHAEVQAIREACQALHSISLKGCVLYSTCEPCPMCFSACHWAGIKKIYFGATIQDAHHAGFNELFIPANVMKKRGKSYVEIQGGLLRRENAELMQMWSNLKGKKVY